MVYNEKMLEVDMSLLEEIEKQLNDLPPEKQDEVLDFIAFLRQRATTSQKASRQSLKEHPAFGAWQNRHIDALAYQQELRSEWSEE